MTESAAAYSADMAWTGQFSAHAPHETHLAVSISYASPFRDGAWTGHIASHWPHEMQTLLSILYAMTNLLSLISWGIILFPNGIASEN
jgi:hypothetical protein